MKVKAIVLAGTAAGILVAAGGCSKKVGGQVVAVVNGQEITQQELNAELNGATIPPGANRNQIMAQLLQRVIDRKLMVAQAKKQGLDQSPAYLSQVQRAQDNILIDLMAANTMKNVSLPNAAAADKFIGDNPGLFGARKRYQLQQIAFPASNDPALAAKLKAAKTMDEVVAALKAANIQYQTGEGILDTASIPPAAAQSIAALPPGVPFLVPQNGLIVANVIRSAEPVSVPLDREQTSAIQLMRRQGVEKTMRQQLATERSTAKITYAPGFAPPKQTGPIASTIPAS